MRLALLLCLVAAPVSAQPYPPELPPIRPAIPILFMVVPAPQLDLPSAPPGEPIDFLGLCPSNVFTDQAECSAYCANGIVGANQSYVGDPANPTRVRVVRCEFLPTYVAPNAMSTELSGISTNTLPGVNVTALRDQYRADRVTLFDNDGSACGLGYINAAKYGKAFAFSVVNKACAWSNLSLVHEWGHNDGLCHDLENASGCTPATPYAYGFCDSAHGRRSPMVYPSPCGGSRVPLFSNKDNTWTYGYAFGDATHDEAAVQRWAMPIEANFYPPLVGTPPRAGAGSMTAH